MLTKRLRKLFNNLISIDQANSVLENSNYWNKTLVIRRFFRWERVGCVNKRAWTYDNDRRGCLQSNVLLVISIVGRTWVERESAAWRVTGSKFRSFLINTLSAIGACLTFSLTESLVHLFMQQARRPHTFNFLNIISQFPIVFVVLMDVALLPPREIIHSALTSSDETEKNRQRK